jgi:UPF0755 protein
MSERLDESIFGGGDVADERGRYHRTQQRRRRRGGIARRWVALLVALGIFVGGAYLAKQFVEPIWARISSGGEIDFPGPGEGAVKVVIKGGQDGEVIASTLKSAGVIKTRTAFLDVVRANPQKAAAIQAGTYTMKKGMAAKDAFTFLLNPANRVGAGITVREGLWASEIYPILSKATGVPLAEYQKAAANPKALGLPAAAKGKVEGWLFPATYEFPDKATATVQLRTMIAKAVAEMKRSGVAEADWEKTMIVASIVEAEANQKADLAKVARVIDNRVANQGPPNFGLLQFDSTVSYGVKRRSITTTDKERGDTNPWNTYVHKGLPIGPISNPGATSIQAAAHPATGTWLFFVAVNPETGETRFANTLAEHQQNVALFQAWCQDHPGKC